jgi:hypothetical protein
MTDYNPNIPQSSNNLGTSQAQMLNNFGKLDSIFDVNHFKYSDATTANQGKHRKIDFPATTTVSSPAGAASVIYPKDVSGVSAAYFENAVGGSVLWRGGSTDGLSTISTGSGVSNGYLLLPNGIKFIWGHSPSPADNGTITFAGGGFATNCFNVQISGVRDGITAYGMYIKTGTVTTTQFQVRVDPSASFADIYYFAIGN